MDKVLPIYHPDGSITFPSQQALDMYVSAVGEVEHSAVMEAGFEIGKKQALEVIEAYPEKTIGANQFKQDLFNALRSKDKAANPDLVHYSMTEVKDMLLHMMHLVVFENGYPIKAVPQATILSLPQLMKIYRKNNTTNG